MLKVINKTELLRQFENIRNMVAEKNIKLGGVLVPHTDMTKSVVCGVRTTNNTCCICTTPEDTSGVVSLMMKILSDTTFKPKSFDELEEKIKESPAENVVVGWDTDNCSAIVKCFAISHEGTCDVYLFPGPTDIEEVNKDIKEYRKTHDCGMPEDADCDDCPKLMDCKVLDDAEKFVKEKRGIK